MRPCGNPGPHAPHPFVVLDEEQLFTQDSCPGVPEPPPPPPPLHGHGGGSHPDACSQCWWEEQHGC